MFSFKILSINAFAAACLLGCAGAALAAQGSPAPVMGDAAMTDRLFVTDNDPLEPLNRQVFTFNRFVDDYFLAPVAKGYRTVTPQVVRDRIGNVLSTVREPRTAVNALLQGDLRKTGDALTRFMVNATFGLFGMFDVAGAYGVTTTGEDFGQTLAEWGVPSGPYLMLPLLGPSSPRDVTGTVADSLAFDPLAVATQDPHYEGIWYTQNGVRIVDLRARNIENIEALRRSSVDFYAKIRSLYWQRVQNNLSPAAAARTAGQGQLDQEFDNYFDGDQK
jgi:phospholipid-binding lipoprotein MlaA